MGKSSELTKTDVSENHQKINVNATADVWQNRGGRTFRNRHGCSEKQIIIVFVKKHWFLCHAQNLEFQPGLSLTKDVKTPNSVWGTM